MTRAPRICRLSEVDAILTHTAAAPEMVQTLRLAGVRVILA